jgi:dTDP-4-amino-4,6-dideoxygalactose transaminase
MNVKFLDLVKNNETFKEEFHQVLEQILNSGQFVSGQFVNQFENNFSSAIGTSHAVACNSGTSALYVALIACGIKQGDEVIVPSMTFVATIEAVVQVGAIPVLVDVDESHWNLNAERTASAITKNTRAIIFVHLHGNPGGISQIKNLAIEHNLILIEDAAQAHLASSGEKSAGSIGDIAAFSFYPGKNLGAIGEGGCVTTNSLDLYEKAKLVINWGSRIKYQHEIRGANFRMDEIQAAFLNIKLRKLSLWLARRNEVANLYNQFFDEISIVRPQTEVGNVHAYHIYAILVKNRQDLQLKLKSKGVETGVHYPYPISGLMPWAPYTKVSGDNSTSKKLADTFLSIPISDTIKNDEVSYIIENISNLIKS